MIKPGPCSAQYRQRLFAVNTYMVQNDEPYDFIEKLGKYAGARGRIEKAEGLPRSKQCGEPAPYGNPYNDEKSAKAWRTNLLDAVVGIEVSELPLQKQDQLDGMLAKLKAQCQDDRILCQDINRAQRREVEQWLRENKQYEAADDISEETVFDDFDMRGYTQSSDAPFIKTKYGSWQLRC